jgi:hypothetical protein
MCGLPAVSRDFDELLLAIESDNVLNMGEKESARQKELTHILSKRFSDRIRVKQKWKGE